MTLQEMIEFDTLRYKQTRTVPEEVRYRELEERVIKGADGLSEFPTGTTEGETMGEAFANKALHDELCSKIAARFFKDLALYGPAVGNTVMQIVFQVIKTLKP